MTSTEMQKKLTPPVVILGVITAVSILVRVASALLQGDSIQPLPGVHDQISYDLLAQRVLAGNGFSFADNWWPATQAESPTAHWSYLYTLYLTAVYEVLGHHPLGARILQAVISGCLFPLLTWRLGSRLFGSAAGLVAAGLAALYGYYVFYAGALMTETFYILAILWALDLATRIRADAGLRSRTGLWIQLGFALGLAVLLRQVFLMFVPALFVWLFLFTLPEERRPARALRGNWRGIAIAFGVLVLMIAPWTFRNYRAFGQFALLNSSAGYAFYWGNHPIHGTSFIPILPSGGPSYGELIPDELRSLDEIALERELMRRGIEFVTDDPARFVILSLSRAKEYFKFWPSAQSGLASNVVRVTSFGLLVPFVLVGLWISFRAARSNGRAAPGWLDRLWCGTNADLALLLSFVALYTAIHLFSWTLVRYRLPVDAVLIVFASAGIVWILERSRVLQLPVVDGIRNRLTVFLVRYQLS